MFTISLFLLMTGTKDWAIPIYLLFKLSWKHVMRPTLNVNKLKFCEACAIGKRPALPFHSLPTSIWN